MTQPTTIEPIDPDALADVQASAPPEEMIRLVVDVFQSLADPTRARILYALGHRSLCVRDLSLLAGVSESAISHQMRFLRDRRIVSTRREGNVIYYALDDHHLMALIREAEYHADHVRRGLPDHSYP